MAEELSSAIEQITSSIVQVISALEQIEKAAALANEDARKNTEVANQCQEHVARAAELLDTAFSGLGEVSEAITQVSDQIAKLATTVQESVQEGDAVTDAVTQVEKELRRITKILRGIENTIIQTTMLAVSGSVEAARAGEFGKGFAVVSSDIRNLAQDAGANLEKIDDILTNLDEEVDRIARDWSNGLGRLSVNADNLGSMATHLQSIEKELEEVVNMVENLKRANEENAAALNQAQQGSEQIKLAADQAERNVAESKTAAQLIRNTLEEMGQHVEELAVLADELQSSAL